jgi:hypothetical protein
MAMVDEDGQLDTKFTDAGVYSFGVARWYVGTLARWHKQERKAQQHPRHKTETEKPTVRVQSCSVLELEEPAFGFGTTNWEGVTVQYQ